MKIKLLIITVFLLLIISCNIFKPVIKDGSIIDYTLYQGKWYEIARLPNPVEDGLVCVTMTYEFQHEGMMNVTSRGRSKSDREDIKTLSGRAWVPDAKEPRKIKIQFIWPVTIDYLLLHIDVGKGYAVLGSPYKHQLWILSRTPVVNENDFSELLKIAEKNQYRLESLVRVEQGCE